MHPIVRPCSIPLRWFSIVMYLAFLIAVIVVLLNVLIAQMSNSYSEIQQDVDSEFTIARARIIAKALKANTFYFKVKNWYYRFSFHVWVIIRCLLKSDLPLVWLDADKLERHLRELYLHRLVLDLFDCSMHYNLDLHTPQISQMTN